MTKPDADQQPAEGSPDLPPPSENSPGTEDGRDQPDQDATIPESIDADTGRKTP